MSNTITQEKGQLDVLIIGNQESVNNNDVTRVVVFAIFIALIDIFAIPITALITAIASFSMDGEYVVCDDGYSYHCYCDVIEDYCDTLFDSWFMGVFFFGIFCGCIYEGCLLGAQCFILIFKILWGDDSFATSMVVSFGVIRKMDGFATANFIARMVEFIWIVILVGTYSKMESCGCENSPSELTDSFYERRTLDIYCIMLLILITIFLLSRRMLRCCIKNIRVTQQTQLLWLQLYHKEADEANERDEF